MVDYSKWDELAASIGEDYEKEDEEGKRQWLSKWEIENAQLQAEWLGNDKAAEQQAPDARATWNAGGGEGSLRSQLGLRDDDAAVVGADEGGSDRRSALEQMMTMPAFQRALRGDGAPSEEDMRELEALAASARNRDDPTAGVLWVPPSTEDGHAARKGDKPIYKDAIRGKSSSGVGGRGEGGRQAPVSMAAWNRIGLTAPQDTSACGSQRREERLRTLCAAATFDPEEEAAGVDGGGRKEMLAMQVVALGATHTSTHTPICVYV